MGSMANECSGWYNLPFPAVDNLDEVALADIKLHMMRRKRKADRKLAIRPSPEHF